MREVGDATRGAGRAACRLLPLTQDALRRGLGLGNKCVLVGGPVGEDARSVRSDTTGNRRTILGSVKASDAKGSRPACITIP